MDLGKHDSPIGRYDGRTDAELLTEIRAEVTGRRASEVREWVAIVAWADQNTVDCPVDAATVIEGVLDTGVPIAGDGAPLVSEFNLMELIATLDRSPDGGRLYVGRVIECAWRLPAVYTAVVEGKLAPWRALRIADLTHGLNAEAAGFVGRQLFNAAGCTWAQVERLVDEAIIRFDPERAEAERKKAADQRRFDIDDVDPHGLVDIRGLMDAADGHDLDQAIRRRAELLGRLGDDSSLDVRRSKAAAELARQDLGQDLLFADESTGEVLVESPGRKVVLNVHVTGGSGAQTDTSLTDDESSTTGGSRATTDDPGPFGNPANGTPANNPVGRWDEGRCPITTTQIREWLQAPRTTVIVRPVIDLKDCDPVDSYEIPNRHRRQVELRDHTCRFPYCTKPAVKCDLDHAVAYSQGGPTCPCQLVPKCRRHHRAKTFSLWRYVIIQPGHYLWISPHGQHWLVGPGGTRALDPPRAVDPDIYDEP